MSLAVYCTQTDVEDIWSLYGVAVRIDDRDAEKSTERMTAMLEKASADINFYLFQTYSLAACQNNAWVKWCAAYFCAVAIAKRRGNTPPQPILEEYENYKNALLAIKAGEMALPSDSGLAAPTFDNLAFVTNFQVQSQYRAKIRRVPHTSTQMPQAPSRHGYDAQLPAINYW